jgi:hypothetical protein
MVTVNLNGLFAVDRRNDPIAESRHGTGQPQKDNTFVIRNFYTVGFGVLAFHTFTIQKGYDIFMTTGHR